MEHFLVALLVVKWDDRDAIIDLVGKWVYTIVNYNHVFHLTISDDTEVFDIVAFRSLNAVLSVQSILEELILWIYII